MQVDLVAEQELVPDAVARPDVAAVANKQQDVAEPRPHHAVDQVVEHGQKRARAQRQRPGMTHVMLADAAHQPFGHNHLRARALRDRGGDVDGAAPVVLHGQVLEVLLDGGHRDDARLQLASVHALAELAAGMLSQQDLGGARHPFAPGKCSFATSRPHSVRHELHLAGADVAGQGHEHAGVVIAPAVPLLEPHYHLADRLPLAASAGLPTPTVTLRHWAVCPRPQHDLDRAVALADHRKLRRIKE